MRSKFPSAHYLTWIHTFLSTVPCHLVFFTSEELLPTLHAMRPAEWQQRTLWCVLPKEQWTAYTRWGRAFWERQETLDRERGHSAELYAVWAEKCHFVRRALELNPFGHATYIWCDAGAFRTSSPLHAAFSTRSRVPHDKMVLLQIEPFTDEERAQHAATGVLDIDLKCRIGGGVLAASAEVWKTWCALYDETLQRWRDMGLYVGKDQSIYASIVLSHPELVELVQPRPDLGDKWFTLLFVL